MSPVSWKNVVCFPIWLSRETEGYWVLLNYNDVWYLLIRSIHISRTNERFFVETVYDSRLKSPQWEKWPEKTKLAMSYVRVDSMHDRGNCIGGAVMRMAANGEYMLLLWGTSD